MSTSSNNKSLVPILQGPSDYFDWSLKMKAILMARSRLVWRRVTDEAPMPHKDEHANEYIEWEAAGDQAIELVFQGLEGEALSLRYEKPKKSI